MEVLRRTMNPLALEFIPSEPYQGTADTQIKHDYFSPLPPELLDIIFDLAHSQSPLTGPISSSLTPFWRARKFEKVHIEGYKQLASFANNVSIGTLALVRAFDVSIPPFTSGFTARLDNFNNESFFEELKVPKYYREDTIKSLFRNLRNVETLSLSGSSRLARLFLSPSVSLAAFPKLDSLSIKSTFEGLHDPFHPAHFASLAFHDELTILEISIFRHPSSIDSSQKELPTLSLNNITPLVSLQLSGPISASEGARPLVYVFPAACTTALDDSASPSQIHDYLDAVFPGTLELMIHARVQIPVPLEAFRRIDSLRSLALIGGLVPTGSEFYDLLTEMPLISLQFGGGNELSTDGLISLVSGSKRITTLETLVIDEVMIGPTPSGRTVEVPIYTPQFTREGFEKLIELGETEGVEILGRAVEAQKTVSAVEEEMIMHQLQNQRAVSLAQALMRLARSGGIPSSTVGNGVGGTGGGHRGRGRGNTRGRGAGRGGGRRRGGRGRRNDPGS